jgi:hypothetical protein
VIREPQRMRLEIAQPTAYMVGSYTAVLFPIGRDQSSPVERPRRVTMDKEQRRSVGTSRSFVDVVHAHAGNVAPLRGEGIQGTPIGRSRGDRSARLGGEGLCY